MSGLLESLWGAWSSTKPDPGPLLEVLLMVALADGDIGPDEWDRIGRAVRDFPDLQGLDWDEVVHAAEVLAEEAPLFFDARARVVEQLQDRPRQLLALSIAARVIGGSRPLTEEERVVLASLAVAFGIEDGDVEELVEQRSPLHPGTEDLGITRCAFNGPSAAPQDIWSALQQAQDDERRMLLFKLTAARRVMWTLTGEEPPSLIKLGELIGFGSERFRLDALIEYDARRLICRFLAPGEALHRSEHAVLQTILSRLPETAEVLVAHQGPLSPEDDSFLRERDPSRLRVLRIPDEVRAG